MSEIYIPNLILVGSTARKQGKTSFMCDFIRHFNSDELMVIKITNYIFDEGVKEYSYRQETFDTAQGDTLRMLKAGAKNVFYSQMDKDKWELLVEEIYKHKNVPIICESAWLRTYVKPGVFVMFDGDSPSTKKPYSQQMLEHADIKTSLTEYKDILPKFTFVEGKWSLI